MSKQRLVLAAMFALAIAPMAQARLAGNGVDVSGVRSARLGVNGVALTGIQPGAAANVKAPPAADWSKLPLGEVRVKLPEPHAASSK